MFISYALWIFSGYSFHWHVRVFIITIKKIKTANATIIIYLALALLFQPFLKVALGRTLWNVVDVIVGVGLICSLFIKKKTFMILIFSDFE